MNAIITQLAAQFGLSPAQAESAAGAILHLVQTRAAGGDFERLIEAMPPVRDWIGQAAAAPAGGLLGSLGSLAGSLGGSGGELGGLLAAVQQAGLKPELLAQFVPALLQQLSQHVDPALIARLLEAVPALRGLGAASTTAASGGDGLGAALGGLLGKLGG